MCRKNSKIENLGEASEDIGEEVSGENVLCVSNTCMSLLVKALWKERRQEGGGGAHQINIDQRGKGKMGLFFPKNFIRM